MAITGSLFGSVLLDEVPKQIAAQGVPAEMATQFARGGGQALNNLSGVGDLGAAILAQLPPEQHDQVAPFIDAIVTGIHEAFSIATASTFTVGIVSVLLASLIVVVLMPRTRIGDYAAD